MLVENLGSKSDSQYTEFWKIMDVMFWIYSVLLARETNKFHQSRINSEECTSEKGV